MAYIIRKIFYLKKIDSKLIEKSIVKSEVFNLSISVIHQLQESIDIFDLAKASRRLRRFRYERIDPEIKRPASPGTCRWFPVHVRVFMASEFGANAATLDRSRTTRENRVTPLPLKRIAYYRQTRERNSHTRIPRMMSFSHQP